MEHNESSAPMPIWEAQKAIGDALGMRNVYYNGLPQRNR